MAESKTYIAIQEMPDTGDKATKARSFQSRMATAEILGICEGVKEGKAGWSGFLNHLKKCGLTGVRLIISDAGLGLAESAAEFFPDACWHR